MQSVIDILSAFDNIPDEIICEIFQWIGFDYYHKVALVNKRFNHLITQYKSKAIFALAKRRFPSIQILKYKHGIYAKLIKNKDKIIAFGYKEQYSDDVIIWFYIRGDLKYVSLYNHGMDISKSRYNHIRNVLLTFGM